MSTYSVGFDIFAKDRASATFDAVGRQVDSTGGRLDKFKEKAKVAGVVAGAAIVAFGKTSITAYVDAEKSQRVLEDAYARFPAIADVPIAKLREMAQALQAKTKFDGDDINAMQGKLAAYGLTGAELQKLTPLVLDYAEKTGKDLPTASEDMGKAILGQGRALKEVGLDFKDTGSAAGNLDQLMGGLRTQVGGFAEKEGKSAEGQAEILKNKFGDLEEKVGAKLLPTAEKLTDWLSKAVTFIDDNSDAIGALVVTLGTVVVGVKAWTVAQWLLNFALTANPIGVVVMAVAALVAGIIYLATQTDFFQKAWKEMTNLVAVQWRWMWNLVIAPIIRFILNGFATLTSGIASFLRALGNIPGFGWAKTAADKMDAAANKARALAKGIRDIPAHKGVTITVQARANALAVRAMGLASGGQTAKLSAMVRGYATGGEDIPAGLAWVGEKGPELIDVPEGSNIYDAQTSARMAAGPTGPSRAQVRSSTASEQPIVVQLVLGGKVIQEELLRLKRTNGGTDLGLK